VVPFWNVLPSLRGRREGAASCATDCRLETGVIHESLSAKAIGTLGISAKKIDYFNPERKGAASWASENVSWLRMMVVLRRVSCFGLVIFGRFCFRFLHDVDLTLRILLLHCFRFFRGYLGQVADE